MILTTFDYCWFCRNVMSRCKCEYPETKKEKRALILWTK
jgi:hypothetical protein